MTRVAFTLLKSAEATAYSQAAIAVHWAAALWGGAIEIRMRAIADELEAKAKKLREAL